MIRVNRYFFGLVLVLTAVTALLISQNTTPSAINGLSINSTSRTLQNYSISFESIEPENLLGEAPDQVVSPSLPFSIGTAEPVNQSAGIVSQIVSSPIDIPQENYSYWIYVSTIIILALALVIIIQSKKIENEINRWLFRVVSFAALFIAIPPLLALPRKISNIPDEGILGNETFLSFVDFMLQELEGLPTPFSQPENIIRIFLYAILFSFVVRFSISIFVNFFKSIAKSYFENLDRKRRGPKGSKGSEIERYYRINLSQTIISFWLSFFMIFLGFFIVVFVIGAAIFVTDLEVEVAIIAGVSAILLEFIGGTSLLLYGKNIQYFSSFFRALTRSYDIENAKEIADEIKDKPGHGKTVADIIYSLAYRPDPADLNPQNIDSPRKERKD